MKLLASEGSCKTACREGAGAAPGAEGLCWPQQACNSSAWAVLQQLLCKQGKSHRASISRECPTTSWPSRAGRPHLGHSREVVGHVCVQDGIDDNLPASRSGLWPPGSAAISAILWSAVQSSGCGLQHNAHCWTRHMLHQWLAGCTLHALQPLSLFAA